MTGQKPTINQHDYALEGVIKPDLNSNPTKKNCDVAILAVDDDPNILHSTQALLRTRDYHCQIVDSGEAALSIFETQSIDLLLLDLSMPGTDGFSVLKSIKKKQYPIEVIIISGEATFENADKVYKSGACDFLKKPYKPKQLLSAIDSMVYKINLKRKLSYLKNQLELSEQKYRFIANNSPDIIYLIDQRGFFLYVNDRIFDLLGYKPEDLVGEHYTTIISGEDKQKAEFIFNERRTGDRSSKNIELLLKCNDSSSEPKPFESNTIIIELNSMGIYEDKKNGTPYLGTYGVARDVSERMKALETIHFQAYLNIIQRLLFYFCQPEQ